MSKKTKDLPLRVIKPPLDAALEELKKQESTVVQRTTVGKRTTVVLKTTVTFVPYEEVFSEDDPDYWFKYVMILHWLMDNLYPQMMSRVSKIYATLVRLAYGIKSNNGVCKAGYGSLEKASGVSKKHVRQAIKEIQKMGAIKVVQTENKGKQGGGSIYKVFVPKEAIDTVVKRTTVGEKTTVV